MTDTPTQAPATGAPVDDDDVEDLLDQWLLGSLEEIGDHPADEEQVDRLVWAMRHLKQRHDDVLATARRRADLVHAWAAEELERVRARSAGIEEILAGWAHGERERTGRQTVSLPAGKLKLTARRQSVLIEGPSEDQTVLDVGALAPEAVKTVHTVQVTPLKEAGLQPGDPIEGYDHPDGYVAHTAVLPSVDTDGHGGFVLVPHVVVLVPVEGRAGYSFKVTT